MPPRRRRFRKDIRALDEVLCQESGHDFRLVFVDGPWPCQMHEDLKPVYSHMGPCYRWANWSAHHPPIDESSAIREIECSLMKTMNSDEGTGEWVGILGFSQGAALAFTILLENQLRLQRDPRATASAGVHWRFGVIMAGRAPPFSLSHITQKAQHYKSLTQRSLCYEKASFPEVFPFATRLRTPTLHVHGFERRRLGIASRLGELVCIAGIYQACRVGWSAPDTA
ncbi:hypothetical protein MMC17_004500 [Xylographa soralifera]|nr:hypothetical protein [Xylographa soralifera]